MMENAIVRGDCTQILKSLPPESVDFVLTDSPYFVHYQARSGRSIRNDLYPGKVLEAFKDMSRVLSRTRFV
jgi:adenine-specific DNA-methyltransferase